MEASKRLGVSRSTAHRLMVRSTVNAVQVSPVTLGLCGFLPLPHAIPRVAHQPRATAAMLQSFPRA
jgi:hypothetical protein